MRSNKKAIVFVLLIVGIMAFLLLFAITLGTKVIGTAVAPPRRIEIPEASWVFLYFEAINEVTEQANWKPLHTVGLPRGSLEIRIWIGFGESPLQGLRLCRNGGKWTGLYVNCGYLWLQAMCKSQPSITEEAKARYESYLKDMKPFYELTPQTSWARLWEKVEALGILTLPDSSTLPKGGGAIDGISYVVEINDGEHYRTYRYDNPQCGEGAEVERIIEIMKTLQDEFQHALPPHMSWGYWR